MKIIGNIKFKICIILLITLIIESNSISVHNSINTRSTLSTNEKNFLTLQKALLSTTEIKVVNIIKKSPRVYTEGLFFENGIIFESGFYKNKS